MQLKYYTFWSNWTKNFMIMNFGGPVPNHTDTCSFCSEQLSNLSLMIITVEMPTLEWPSLVKPIFRILLLVCTYTVH